MRSVDSRNRRPGSLRSTRPPRLQEYEIRTESVRLGRVPVVPLAAAFDMRERWEGCVLDVSRGSFTANLMKVADDDTISESARVSATAEFDLEDVAEADLDRVEPGALFYWYIGYDRRDPETVAKVSIIRFRRSQARISQLPADAVSYWLSQD